MMIEKIGVKCKSRPKPFKLTCDECNCEASTLFESFGEARKYNKLYDGRIKWAVTKIGDKYFNYCPECSKKLNIKLFTLQCDICKKVKEFDTFDEMTAYIKDNEWGNKKVRLEGKYPKWIHVCPDCKIYLKKIKGVRIIPNEWFNKINSK
jgi:hypothetical protein